MLSRTSCPVCSEQQSFTLYRCPYNSPPISHYMARIYAPAGSQVEEALDGAEFRVEECARCHMMYQVQIPDRDLSMKLYEEWIDPETARLGEAAITLATPLAFVTEIAAAVRYLGGVPGTLRCLDYGMGWGTWCAVAKGLGCQVFGAELSDSRRREAIARGIGTIAENEIPGQEFDLINTEQVFEHLPDPRSTIHLLASGLRPGGVLKISVPPSRRIRRLLRSPDWDLPKDSRRSLNPVAPLEHLNCFSRTSLKMLGRFAGLVPLRLPLRTLFLPLHGNTAKEAVRNVLLPLARNLGLRESYVWLRKPPNGSSAHQT